MKAVLASINPQHCYNIAILKKLWEIRKIKPKLEVPFKVYIYCTKAKERVAISSGLYLNSDDLYRLPTGEIKYGCSIELMSFNPDEYSEENFLNGTVIGEFICDRIEEFESEFYNDDTVMNGIYRIIRDEDNPEEYETALTASNEDDSEKFWICRESCLTFDEIKKYIGYDKPEKTFYGWHISDVKIYDKPKELSEFRKYWDSENDIRPCQKGQQCEFKYYDFSEFCEACFIDFDGADCPKVKLSRPPQSWCYVVELPEKETYSAF